MSILMEIGYKIIKTYVWNEKTRAVCLCNCGREFITPKTRLDNNTIVCCGKGKCDFNVRRNINTETNSYRVLDWDDKKKSYECLCKFCYKISYVKGYSIKRNMKCGNCHRFGPQENKRTVKCDVLSMLYKNYKNDARKRNLDFELNFDEFEILVLRDCYYCGSKPQKRKSYRKAPEDKFYSGIDRKDNNFGYTKENVVPCCFSCNRAKNDQSVFDWFASIKRIYELHKLQQN